MASYKNLERIHEIAESLPKLEDVKMNILNVLNLEINKQKEELKGL